MEWNDFLSKQIEQLREDAANQTKESIIHTWKKPAQLLTRLVDVWCKIKNIEMEQTKSEIINEIKMCSYASSLKYWQRSLESKLKSYQKKQMDYFHQYSILKDHYLKY